MKKNQVKRALLGATLAVALVCTFSLSATKGAADSNFSILENNAKAAVATESSDDPCPKGKGICVDGSTILSDHYHK